MSKWDGPVALWLQHMEKSKLRLFRVTRQPQVAHAQMVSIVATITNNYYMIDQRVMRRLQLTD